jgi:hypothetical protein
MRFCILFSTQIYGEILSETDETYTVRLTTGETVTVAHNDVWVLT